MPISFPRALTGVTSACAALLLMFLAAAASQAAVPVELRVVETGGTTLIEQSQLTDTVTFRTDPGADCFGPPGGSGDEVTIHGPTALGAVVDGSRTGGALRPVSITDQFSFGLALCGL